MEEFFNALIEQTSDEKLLDFCRRRVIHGTPYVFHGRENEYYSFRKSIADHFKVHFHEIYIVGSAKLGFSPRKESEFDYDSDIDVAIISRRLFDDIMESIRSYQMELRNSRRAVTEKELGIYHEFLEYVAMGWIRPDKLPHSFHIKDLKNNWFDFFNSISNGKSEVGNYKVAAGVFKSYHHLEMYQSSDLKVILNSKSMAGNKWLHK